MYLWVLTLPFPTRGPPSGVCVLPFVRVLALVFFFVIWSLELGALPLGNGGLRVVFQTCVLRRLSHWWAGLPGTAGPQSSLDSPPLAHR